MPKVSNISIGSSVNKRGKKAFTGENGKLGTAYIYFKQPGTTYPYQIQYQTRSHYTEEMQKKKGAEWNEWSSWKNARAFTSPVLGAVPYKGTQEKYMMKKWMKANKGVNKKSKYVHALTLTGHAIDSAYDGRQFKVRIRTFSKAKATHGSLVYGTVTVWKRTAITNEKMFVDENGGIDLRFHYKGNDDGVLTVNSIKDSKGMELVVPEAVGESYAWSYDDYYSGSLASGYTPAKATINRANLTRDIEYGEKLTCDIVYTNSHGAPTKLSLSNVTAMDTSLAEGISFTYETDSVTGAVVVTVHDSQAAYDAIGALGCAIQYTTKTGKPAKIGPVASYTTLDGSTTEIAKYTFFPPYNTECKVILKLWSYYGASAAKFGSVYMKGAHYTLTRKWWSKNDITSILLWMGESNDKGDKRYLIASAYDSVDISVSTAPKNIYLSPLGENTTWGTAGYTAPETTITFSANIIDMEDEYLNCRKVAWDNMRENLSSVFILRTPYAEEYQILIDKMTITKKATHIYTVTFTGKQVKEIV